VKMFDRPPLLEEPFAQTLSEKTGELELETCCAMVGLVLCCFGLWLRRVMAIKPDVESHLTCFLGMTFCSSAIWLYLVQVQRNLKRRPARFRFREQLAESWQDALPCMYVFPNFSIFMPRWAIWVEI
jgi:hypothetical protein